MTKRSLSSPWRPRGALAVLAAALLSLSGLAASAAPADPAAAKVDTFDAALISAMKAGSSAGVKGRDRELTPAVESAFDLPTMTRFAVGPAWTGMSEAQHAELVRAFTRYTVANYAHNFDSFSGQKFVIQGVQERAGDKIVQAQLVTSKETVALLYRLHQGPAGWKIIDVYYNAISQMTTRRADFTASLQSGGAAALLSHLESLTTKLLS